MDQVGSSRIDLDLDIDLESGGTSEEDARKGQALSDENSKISSKYMSSESSYGSTNARDFSPYENRSKSDEIYYKNKEILLAKFREEMENSANKTTDKKKPKKQSSARPPKPHRPPRGPSLGTSDMKLLKEISELNLKRRRMEKIRTLNKIKKEKASLLNSNLLAYCVTIIFFLVIILQGNIIPNVCAFLF